MNQRKLGIFLSYINIGIQSILGFVYIPILLHYIGRNEYGLYQLMGSFIAYFSIMDFGLSTAVIRFYTKYLKQKNQIGMENILAISVRCYGIVTVLMMILGGGMYTFLDIVFSNSMTLAEIMEAKNIFLLLLLNITITLSTMVFRSVINAHERFLFLKGIETIQLILQPVLVILMLEQHPSAFSVALAQTILNLILSVVRIYYCFVKLHVRIQFHYWDRELLTGFLRLSLSVFAVTLIDQFFWKTNQIILGIINGTAEVAVYSIASLIYMNYMSLSNAISGVYLPHVTVMVEENASPFRLSALFIQIGRWQYYLLALFATGFILFGHQFIQLWAGDGFEEAYDITLLIILPFTIDLIQNIGLAILQAENRYDFRAKIYLAVGILNLIMAIFFGKIYGGVGCAFATGFSMLIGNGLIMNWFYAKKMQLDIMSFWKQIIQITLPILICLGIGYLMNILLSTREVYYFIFKIIGYTAIYVGMIFGWAMSNEERKTVRRVLSKVFS